MGNYSTKSDISKCHATLLFALLPVMKAEIRQNFPLLIFCHSQQFNFLKVTVDLHRSFLLWMVYENDFGRCNFCTHDRNVAFLFAFVKATVRSEQFPMERVR